MELAIVVLFGVFMGNFATSAIFRLPRHIPVFGIAKSKGVPPHCSSCKHRLRMWEYFPIIGWLVCRGHCRYCGVRIPYEYFVAELAVTLLSIAAYVVYGFGELYIITVLFMMAAVTHMTIYATHQKVMTSVLVAMAFTGVIARILQQPELFPVMLSAMLIWMLGVFLLRHEEKSEIRLPLLALMMVIGASLNFAMWPVFWGVFILSCGVSYVLCRSIRLGVTAPLAAVAAMLGPVTF